MRALALLVMCGVAVAAPVDDLSGGDVRAAVDAIERGPTDPDALFAAGRACEDKLFEPAHALAIYDRILRETPNARTAPAAAKRAKQLRELIGLHGEHAERAAALGRLLAEADRLAASDVIARADVLADAAWPGAPRAALWLADWLRRTGRYGDAQVRYERVIARWPDAHELVDRARSGAAGTAIDANDWEHAEELARQVGNAEVRAELLADAARGRARGRWYASAWVALVLAFVALAASLAEASLRGGRHRPPLRPPVEVAFLAPIAAVFVVVSFTAHRAIAPAVTRIALVGLALAWLSGTALDVARARGRAVRTRSLLHVAACVVGVVAIGYIAVTRDGLLDMLAETVKFGPE